MDVPKDPFPRRYVVIPTWVARPLLAITGVLMVAFVAIHMVGNLKILIDPASMDAYAGWLREVLVPFLPRGGLLWILRIVLLVAILLHVFCALSVKLGARRTRTPGAKRRSVRGFLAGLMLPTGVLIGLLLVGHLLDLTIGAFVASEAFAPPDPAFHAAANVLASLSRPAAAAAYALFLVALGLHLAHGLGLAFKDLGGTGRTSLRRAEIVGCAIALAIVLGDGAVLVRALATGGSP